MTADIWAAVDRLTQPQRQRLERDTGGVEWVRLPSLLDQLAEAVKSLTSSAGPGKQQSRPPLNVDCMSLLLEITEAAGEFLREHRIKRKFELGDDLRQVASKLTVIGDDDQSDWWVDECRHWAARIRLMISNNPDRPWNLHGLPCPDCGAKTVPDVTADGSAVRVPAVVVEWARGYVRAVTCRSCDAVWLRGAELEDLAEKILANTHVSPGV